MSSVDGFFSSSGFLILLAEGFGVEASRGFGVYLSVGCWVMRLVNLWWGCGGCTGEGGGAKRKRSCGCLHVIRYCDGWHEQI
jgi:hypothetical protein